MIMPRLVAAVSHCPWIPDRVKSMDRLRAALGVSRHASGAVTCGPGFGAYFEMTDRAHVSVWSARMWAEALRLSDGHGHCVFLQDDDRVPGEGVFWGALRAILTVVPDELIGLHLHHPGAVAAHRAGERFVTTMSCVGVGYVFPAPLLADFLAWRRALGPERVYRTSEDTLIDAWCIFRRRRVWHPVPTIVRPDTRLGSTGGGAGRDDADDQYMRDCVLDWSAVAPVDLVSPGWWGAGLRQPPRHLVFGGVGRPGVSRKTLPAAFDGHHTASRGKVG